mgnify:CR=1 FL=1|jgi:1-acyl-sn-glycerol-3-phosphate acyltransferase
MKRRPFFTTIVYFLVSWFCWGVLRIYNRMRVFGLRDFDKSRQYIVVSNHCSNLDPVVIGSTFPIRLRYLAKSELFRCPGFSHLLLALGAIPVRKQDSQSAGATLKAFLSLLQNGESVLIFPEGGRSEDGTLKPLEGGVALIALKSRVPVLPAFVRGSFGAMPPGAPWIKPVRLSVTYGEPIDPSLYGGESGGKEARGKLLETVSEALLALEHRTDE